MPSITALDDYTDDKGNQIVCGGPRPLKVDIRFPGSRNRILIDPEAKIHSLIADFRGDDGLVVIGPTFAPRSPLRLGIRVGYNSSVHIGQDVGTQGYLFISATEGADVIVGDDVMFASEIELRTDDTHAIYDVRTGERANPSHSVVIGNHVWIAKHAVVMGGSTVGDGSVVGFRSIVTKSVPNNCVAVGAPARVVRRDIAWERPVTVNRPVDAVWPPEGEATVAHWRLTEDGEVAGDHDTGAGASDATAGAAGSLADAERAITERAEAARRAARTAPRKPAPVKVTPTAPTRSEAARTFARRVGRKVRRTVAASRSRG